jgi:hypothetical protein
MRNNPKPVKNSLDPENREPNCDTAFLPNELPLSAKGDGGGPPGDPPLQGSDNPSKTPLAGQPLRIHPIWLELTAQSKKTEEHIFQLISKHKIHEKEQGK